MQTKPKDRLKPGYAGHRFPVGTLLHLAILGGAQVCGLEESIGSFETGKSFDALWVEMKPDSGNPGILPPSEDVVKEEVLRGLLERFLFCGDDRNILRVYVLEGKIIGCKEFPVQEGTY